MVHELKFKKSTTMVASGAMCIVVCIFMAGIFVFSTGFDPDLLPLPTIILMELFLASAIALITGIYYISMPSRTYIKVWEKELTLHMGLVWGNWTIKLADIEEVRFLGNKMFLIMRRGYRRKEIEINPDLLYIKDLDILLERLSLNNISIKRT